LDIFAIARPDIATQVRFRKPEELQQGVNLCQPVKVLTSCPACLQGLSRYRDDVGVVTVWGKIGKGNFWIRLIGVGLKGFCFRVFFVSLTYSIASRIICTVAGRVNTICGCPPRYGIDGKRVTRCSAL
jgi:hypothetical protein